MPPDWRWAKGGGELGLEGVDELVAGGEPGASSGRLRQTRTMLEARALAVSRAIIRLLSPSVRMGQCAGDGQDPS